MLNPHHVEALAYERQRELLETASRLRAGRRHHAGGRHARPDDRGGVLPSRIAAWFARIPNAVRPSRRRQPAVTPTASRNAIDVQAVKAASATDARAPATPPVPNAA
jgi:hypothetical protein